MARPFARGRSGGAPVLLWVVLLLVLTAFGLLVTSLVISSTGWAWGSVGASGVAAGLLVADWATGRRAEPASGHAPGPRRAEPASDLAGAAEPEARPVDEVAAAEPGARPAGDVAAADEPAATIDPAVEPAEEHADVADAIAISDLTDEVRVIDERPRYHLPGCRWVGERDTIPLPVDEARELGFTPCAICTPDARLAALHRSTGR